MVTLHWYVLDENERELAEKGKFIFFDLMMMTVAVYGRKLEIFFNPAAMPAFTVIWAAKRELLQALVMSAIILLVSL